MFASPPLSTAVPTPVETVEAFRRYPAPEVLQLPLANHHPQHSSADAAPSPSTSPDVPDAPRNRSTAASTVSASSASGNSGDSGVRDENKRGAYKTAPTAVPAEGSGEGDEGQQQQQQQTSTRPSQSSSPPPSLTLRLRWGFEAADLRRVYALHEDALPLSYGPSYYEWLLDHDGCIALVATVTKETYARCTDVATAAAESAPAADSAQRGEPPLAWFPGYTPDTAAEAAAGPRPMPPPASRRRLTTEMMAERVEVDRCLTELEYVAQRQQKAAAGDAGATTTTPVGGGGESEEDGTAYTEVVGFILGQCAYARHDAGHLLTNPTAYIGSFIVDPVMQGCGLGSALLERFLHYVTEQRPLYAQDYLHYDERRLIAMLVSAQLKKRCELPGAAEGGDKDTHPSSPSPSSSPIAAAADGSPGSKAMSEPPAAAAAAAATAASTLSTALLQVVAAYLPEAMAWWEDRVARQRLRGRGLSEAEVDAQRFRERLAPDALTDEEADEVRHAAKHFVVQTGVREVWLHCLPGNMRANVLYAHRGFRLHRVLRGYYDVAGEPYDANLLLYARPVSGTVVNAEGAATTSLEAAHPGADQPPAASAAATPGMDAVVRQHDAAAQAQLSAAAAAALGTGEGLRRRRTGGPADETADIISANAEESPSTSASPPPPASAAAAATVRRSLAGASWLSPRSYPVVADVVLCTAADGQEEWQRRAGGSGDVTGRRSWWETAREVYLVVNALGLLCAVLWLAYNVGLTGKVE